MDFSFGTQIVYDSYITKISYEQATMLLRQDYYLGLKLQQGEACFYKGYFLFAKKNFTK